MLLLLFMFGLGLCIAPWFMTSQIGLMATMILSTTGFVVLAAVTVAAVVMKLYQKASANMAFVRTGRGGAKVVRDGGSLVIPVLHEVIAVSLETMRLNVERRGPHALITRDNLRVDLSAEFYIKVQANSDDILQAARSLGSRNVQADAVSELVQEKLVSALRTVAATKELVELHAKRDEFASAVQAIVTHDLSSNGLTLESVTISSLDQTDPTQLQDQNVFDAQGLRKIAEITQRARVERNEIEREAEKLVQEKNVSTTKKVLDLQRDQAEFEAEQRMKVANVRAAKERQIAEFKLSQDEAIARRDIEKNKAVQTSEVERALAIESAQRQKEAIVAQKDQERASAQAAMLAAEAERTAAEQKVLTVQVNAEAQREADKRLIAARQLITENKIREETEAEVLAYMKVKEAEGERDAAELKYAAKLRLADGDAQASIKRADGDRALKMVDVNVDREQVDVEQARVAVERQSLSNKQEFEAAALKFELEKFRINAEREIRMAAAQAMGNMFANADMKIFGDPDTMARMSQQFMRAASFGTAAEGLLNTMPAKGQELIEKLASGVLSQFSNVKGDGNGEPPSNPTPPVTNKAA